MAEKGHGKSSEKHKNSPSSSFTNNPTNIASTSNSGNTTENYFSAQIFPVFSSPSSSKNRVDTCSFNPSKTKPVKSDKKKLSEHRNFPRQKLKTFYKDIQIPSPVWMEDKPDIPIQEYFIQLGLKSTNEEIAVEDIFKNVEHKRILLEGNPGFGKTTLVMKIVNDWALNKQYISRFKFVFFLEMKYLRDKSIDDGIIDVTDSIPGIEAEDIQRNIKIHKRKTLIIIDGLDESTPNQRENVLKALYKQIYHEMTILVTCRTGYFTLNREEEHRLFKGISKAKQCFDEHIIVQGIAHNKNRKEFLLKFTTLHSLSPTDIEQLMMKLENQYFRSGMFDSPLLLILLADYINDTLRMNQEIKTFTTITNLYKMIFNLIIRRSEERKNESVKYDFDVFMESENTEPYRKHLYEFGSVCVDHFLRNELVFSETDTIIQIYQLGLLLKNKNVFYSKCDNSYEVFHLTIIEFMIAFYLYQDFERCNFTEFSPDVEYKMNELFIQCGKTSLIFHFLMGLLKDKVVDFFKIIQPYSYIYSFDGDVESERDDFWYSRIYNIDISEEKVSDLVEVLQHFLPSTLHFDNKSRLSRLWQRLIYKRIENTDLNRVTLVRTGLEQLKVKKNIPLLWFYCNQYNLDKGNISLFTPLPAIRRGLHCDSVQSDEIITLLLSLFEKGILKDTAIDFLNFSALLPKHITVITTLLDHHNVTSLFLTGDASAIEEIIKLLYKENNLDSIYIENDSNKNVVIDLNKLIKEGKKHWQTVGLLNVDFICKKSLNDCVNNFFYKIFKISYNVSFNLNPGQGCQIDLPLNLMLTRSIFTYNCNKADPPTIESLTNLSLLSLYTVINCFFSAMKLSEQWSRNSLRELTVCFESEIDYEIGKSVDYWHNLKSFTQLLFLNLSFEKVEDNCLLPNDEIVQSILCLPIKHLSLFGTELQVPFLLELISQLETSKTVCIKTLSLCAFESFDEAEEIVNKLLMLLETKILTKFCLINYVNRYAWHMVLFRATHKKCKKFCIKYNFLGSNVDDHEWDKYFYTKGRVVGIKQFSVTLN